MNAEIKIEVIVPLLDGEEEKFNLTAPTIELAKEKLDGIMNYIEKKRAEQEARIDDGEYE
jgi:hypothetical protein